MKKSLILLLFIQQLLYSQTNPAITKWLQNVTITGNYYQTGNSTPISNGILVNCQQVRYSTNWVYVNATGIPAYPVGVFTGDGNTNQAGNQNAIYKFPLNPTQNTGTSTATTGGNIGVFINGVSLFDYRDGVAWNNSTNALCGGPGNPNCPGGPMATQAWNRDAIPAEKLGFDCAKGHPAGTNYHHHQNPSAFKYDLNLISTICNTYDSEGLYTINTSQHSPLIGFAYDGFPIYGAYAYTNTNGTGGISRMKSSYQLKSQTTRVNGPAVNSTYFNGYFKEDYEYIAHPSDPTYLDSHNGRFCITPEYPSGIYCYFATVDANHNSAYPYVVGPTYYGNVTGGKVTTVSESTTTYLSNDSFSLNKTNIKVYPNPSTNFITIQTDFAENNLKVEIINEIGQIVAKGTIFQGTTMCSIETDTLYNGVYFVKVSNNSDSFSTKIIINN
ncbi:YHYH protein [Flavobacterium sp.]|uniref:YHYH protein n=1 Tax=Flavobacterium sp. TaxID=239 RepID=UPI0026191AF4|nr:YHYH protein [Flavobacterium sp.]